MGRVEARDIQLMPSMSENIQLKSIFESIPDNISSEIFEPLIQNKNITIERIISKGHSSPESGWHNQSKNEWVIVLQGEAKIVFDDPATEVYLKSGSYLNIPAHTKHKVSWTSPGIETIWLAIHY
ncbi:hypothetical protein MNBD_GAMMA09-3926 [hydrothermal vent metagenome]|uniref:Cupin type-2 domain-containing protein n=1 Tax=hydrothermal vent metagenome TaxID=652676 RepID=A0A3B0Y9S9_9ZZZZ